MERSSASLPSGVLASMRAQLRAHADVIALRRRLLAANEKAMAGWPKTIAGASLAEAEPMTDATPAEMRQVRESWGAVELFATESRRLGLIELRLLTGNQEAEELNGGGRIGAAAAVMGTFALRGAMPRAVAVRQLPWSYQANVATTLGLMEFAAGQLAWLQQTSPTPMEDHVRLQTLRDGRLLFEIPYEQTCYGDYD